MKKILFVAAAIALLGFGSASASEAPKQAELKNGTKIEITGDKVSVIGQNGEKTPAPDATHELANGEKITTKDGKIEKHAN